MEFRYKKHRSWWPEAEMLEIKILGTEIVGMTRSSIGVSKLWPVGQI